MDLGESRGVLSRQICEEKIVLVSAKNGDY